MKTTAPSLLRDACTVVENRDQRNTEGLRPNGDLALVKPVNQPTHHSPAKRFNEVSWSTGRPRSQRVNWWTISPAAMLAA